MSHLVCISHSYPSVASSPSEASTLYVLPDKYFTSLKIVLPIFSSPGATSRWNLLDGMEDTLQIWSSILGRFARRLGSFSPYLVNHICMEGGIGTGMGAQGCVSGHEFSPVRASVYPSVKCSGRLGLFFQSFQINKSSVSIWSSEVNIDWSRSGPFDETCIFKPGHVRIWAVGRVPGAHNSRCGSPTCSLLLDSFSLYCLLLFSCISSSSAIQGYLFFADTLPAVNAPLLLPSQIASCLLFPSWFCPWRVSALELSKDRWLPWWGTSGNGSPGQLQILPGDCSSEPFLYWINILQWMRPSLALGEPTVELRSFLTSWHLGVTTASEEHHSLQRKDFCLLELGSALLGSRHEFLSI